MRFSEDKAKEGGNLGWRSRQDLNGVFAEAAFKLAKGKARTRRAARAATALASERVAPRRGCAHATATARGGAGTRGAARRAAGCALGRRAGA